MEVKEWTYEAYPSFEEVEGTIRIPTTGDEKGTCIHSNVEYRNSDIASFPAVSRQLQVLVFRSWAEV